MRKANSKAHSNGSLKTYVILLRRLDNSAIPIRRDLRLDERAVTPAERNRILLAARRLGVLPLDLITTLGTFEVVLLCQARSTELVGKLVDILAEDWQPNSLYALTHSRWEFVSEPQR